MKLFKSYRWAILSGILIGTSFIPFFPWAIFFCYTPLWWDFFKKGPELNWRQVFLRGWWTQFILSLIGFYWISFVAHEYGFFPWPVAILTLVLFASLAHLYIPFSLLIVWFIQKKISLTPLGKLSLLALIASLGEIYWPSIFPWNLAYPFMGTSFKLAEGIAQTSDFFGFQGLSLLIYLTNAFCLYIFYSFNFKKLSLPKNTSSTLVGLSKNTRLGRSSLGRFLAMACLVLFWLALSSFGLMKQKEWKEKPLPETLKVLIVQANIANELKVYIEKGKGYRDIIIKEFLDLSRDGLKKHPQTDLLVWPESAFPDYLNPFVRYRKEAQQVIRFLKEVKTPLMVGARSLSQEDQSKEYNALFLLDNKGDVVGEPYHKNYLLAFGEYTPFARQFPFLAKLSPAGIGFESGSTGPDILSLGNIRFGTQICYESLSPEFTSRAVKKGAQILINITNDSWFGPTFEPYQHLYMTLARAIESRRPLIRSTNTGISTVIEASGKIHNLTPLYRKVSAYYELKYDPNTEMTFYTKYGAWLPFLIFLLIVVCFYRGRKNERSK